MTIRTSLVVQLLHDLSDNLSNRLHGLDVILRLLKVLLDIFQREPDCNGNASARATGESNVHARRTVFEVLATVLMLPHFLQPNGKPMLEYAYERVRTSR